MQKSILGNPVLRGSAVVVIIAFWRRASAAAAALRGVVAAETGDAGVVTAAVSRQA